MDSCMHDLSELTDDRIETWITNHEKQKATSSELYRRLIEEGNRRHGQGLDLHISIPFIVCAARNRTFVSYAALAEVNKQDWHKVRYPMNKHLGDIMKFCRHRDWPPLTAIVVNKKNTEAGTMEADTLRGFVDAARWLGYLVDLPAQAFLRRC